MEIRLVKKETRDFNIDEEKCKSFDFDDIMFLTGAKYEPSSDGKYEEYIAFKTRDEFIANVADYDIDTSKKVIINEKGYFFCPLKSFSCITPNKKKNDETGNTKAHS